MFSKSEPSNSIGAAIGVGLSGFLACMSAFYFFRDAVAWVALPLFVVLTLFGVRGFMRPFVATLEASADGVSLLRSDREGMMMPWSAIESIQVFEADGVDAYLLPHTGHRIKLSGWIPLSGEDIDQIIAVATRVAPRVRVDDGRAKTA